MRRGGREGDGPGILQKVEGSGSWEKQEWLRNRGTVFFLIFNFFINL